MPRRSDIESILIIGSGPIVIGQACEFDYSGTQGCKALREEGFRIILVNSNPATIMTDPEMADRTYIEPMTVSTLEKIIERERPNALLPTLGGQTALNLTVALAEAGILEAHGVQLIGASLKAILKAEDRDLFRVAIQNIGLDVPSSGYVRSAGGGSDLLARIGLPAIIRPSFTLGGSGAGIARTHEEYHLAIEKALEASPRDECLVEESVLGWKEYELEVMRDAADNVVIVCSIENLDPMGVHTGDSITVAPAQTLTDKEYQVMRDAAIAIIREIGVDTGGSNIQFAVNPADGRLVVIEMNPRVSRSSALASKATGFPIAKIAAKLAIGYTLDEISNDITRATPACFEPTIDYVVTKIPRFTFEKFSEAENVLNTQMKSVGEVMGIGRTFKESLQKALRSLEIGSYGLERPNEFLERDLETPSDRRLWAVAEALRRSVSIEEIHNRSGIDPWFLAQLQQLVAAESFLQSNMEADRRSYLRPAKDLGFSDRRLAELWDIDEAKVRALRHDMNVRPVYKRVDTCGAEFEAHTPYLYSTYEQESEALPSSRRKIVILGGGPNRIGQGIEFDYCCVHAAFTLREAGFETIMVNCNPETVSTDYDTSDRLYFEPVTLEDVLEIVERERPEGVIVQYGGQTPLGLAIPLEAAGVPILGTPPDAIDRAEDRERFNALLEKLGLNRPPSGMARSAEEAAEVASRIGYPVLVRPSYVLGGRAMEIACDRDSLDHYMRFAVDASPQHPVLVDRFLADAIEVDVDAICDTQRVLVGAVMEHIEEAGIHSGDSACSIPAWSLPQETVDEIATATRELALELGVCGLMNVQFAVKSGEIYVLEVNPRASRTVPFVSKAIGVPLAKLAALVMVGVSLDTLGFTKEIVPDHFSVKAPVFPFNKFPGVDPLPGPEMRSTGEVMGIDSSFGRAYAKAWIAAGGRLPLEGTALITVRPEDRSKLAAPLRDLADMGFSLLATVGTKTELASFGVNAEVVPKVGEGSPNIVEHIAGGKVDLLINTVGPEPNMVADSAIIRRAALGASVPCFTTAAAARAAVGAIRGLRDEAMGILALQEIHAEVPNLPHI